MFEPSLEDTHTVVLSMLEAAVVAASDLPCITPASASSGATVAAAASGAAALGSSPGVIPSTGLGEQMVRDTLKVRGYPLGCLLTGYQWQSFRLPAAGAWPLQCCARGSSTGDQFQCMSHCACVLGVLLPCRRLQRLCLPMPARRGSWPPCLCPTCTSCSWTLLSTPPHLQQVWFYSCRLAV